MRYIKTLTCLVVGGLVLTACGKSKEAKSNEATASVAAVNEKGELVNADATKDYVEGLPFSPDSIREHVVLDYGRRVIRSNPDETIHPAKVTDKRNCFIVMSKKDFYLYVYEAKGTDTVMVARYDCAFSVNKGDKTREGDGKTPSCDMAHPFYIQDMQNAHDWKHDFGDGRGSIRSYGDYFLRLKLDGHPLSNNRSIGIHGSTNNRESVPGRASEGCIRLKDEDIIDLAKNYAFKGMKVVIKDEHVDDYPFEIRAMKKQHVNRLRHFAGTLDENSIKQANPEQGRKQGEPSRFATKEKTQANAYEEDGEGRGVPIEQIRTSKTSASASAEGEGSGKPYVVNNKDAR